MQEDRRREDWKDWSEERVKQQRLEQWQRLSDYQLKTTPELATRLGEKHARSIPDFHWIIEQDRGMFDRLVRTLPAWSLCDVRRMRRLRTQIERVLANGTAEDRDALRDLCESYDGVALAYAEAGYITGHAIERASRKAASKRTTAAEAPTPEPEAVP